MVREASWYKKLNETGAGPTSSGPAGQSQWRPGSVGASGGAHSTAPRQRGSDQQVAGRH